MRYDVGAQLPVGLTVDQLTKAVSPGGKGDMEGVPMPLYDTQQYASTVTTQLTFFAATAAAGAGLFQTNMTQAGQLPNPDFHVIQCITLDVIGLDPVVGTGTNDQDLYYILNGITAGQSPYASLKFASKDYGPWPITALHGTGGVTGPVAAVAAAPENANNSVPDGGVWIGGAIVIPPLQAFSLDIRWPAAVTLTTTPLWLKVGLWGTYYRQIH